jgi:hypothetical protein
MKKEINREGWRSMNAIPKRPSNTGPPARSPAGPKQKHDRGQGKARTG